MFQSGLSCARSRWAKAIACVVGLATIGGTVSEARAGKTIAYYRFENGTAGDRSGKIADSEGGPTTAGRVIDSRYSFTPHTPVNTVPRTGEPNLLAGHFGSDIAKFSYGFPLVNLNNSTIEFWIEPRFDCRGCRIDLLVSVDESSGSLFIVDFTTDNQGRHFFGAIYVDSAGKVHDIARSGIGCFVNEWCFVAIVKSGNQYTIYINNRKTNFKTRFAATGALSPTDLKPSTYWKISGYDKKLDEIRLSNEALRPSEFLVKQPKLPE